MEQNGTGSHRWFLVVKPEQRDLFSLLRERLDGSGVEVVMDRRRRERRRGSFGPAMDRRATERRRTRAMAVLSAAAPEQVSPLSPAAPEGVHGRVAPVRDQAIHQLCPTCAEAVEHEMPRFPHPPARVEMEVGHVKGNGRSGHYVEIAAFTISGRLILSQRVPARRAP